MMDTERGEAHRSCIDLRGSLRLVSFLSFLSSYLTYDILIYSPLFCPAYPIDLQVPDKRSYLPVRCMRFECGE